jgi:integrase
MNKKDIYTNHSIRATGATILGRNCSMAQIMAVNGHKSASSVAVYQRVSSKEKQAMGDRRPKTYISVFRIYADIQG